MVGSLVPTVDVRLESEEFRILALTVNPIFFVAKRRVFRYVRAGLFFLPPKRDFEVWIELVLGHHANVALPVPPVRFTFNNNLKSAS